MSGSCEESACYAHPAVVTRWRCEQCSRPICTVCAFDITHGRFCPDCMCEAPSDQDRHKVFGYAIGSILAAILSFAFMAAVVVGASAGLVADGGGGAIAGILALATTLVGVGLGFVGREQSVRTGSPLALIGLAANGVMVTVMIVLSVVGTFST